MGIKKPCAKCWQSISRRKPPEPNRAFSLRSYFSLKKIARRFSSRSSSKTSSESSAQKTSRVYKGVFFALLLTQTLITLTFATSAHAVNVTSVSSSTANGSYRAGQTINVQVIFNGAVTVNTAGGTPTLTLETGASDAAVNYTSGSGTSTLVFSYTIAAGHTSSDLNYISTSALALNGGTLKDSSNNNVTITLPSLASASSLAGGKNLVVDTTAPTVTLTSSAATNTATSPIPLTITFSQTVTGFVSSDLTIGNGTVTSFSGSGASYTAQITPSANGAVTVNVNAGVATDPAGNGNTAAAQLTRTFDNVNPSVTGVTASNADGTFIVGQTITVQVTMSEAVTVSGGPPRLTLATGGGGTAVNYSSGSGSSTLVFTYTVASGHVAADLDYLATTSLALNGSTIRDGALNNATLTLPTPGTTNSLGANKNFVVDGIVPTVSSVSSTTPNGNYKTGDIVAIDVNFTEAVIITGAPQLTLETGSSDAVLTYSGPTGTPLTTLTFSYTVASGHSSADLDCQAAGALTLNGGTINDANGNAATRTLPIGASAGSLRTNKALVIDAVAPTVSSVTSSTTNGAYQAGQDISIQVTFAEAVTVTGIPQLTLETGATDAVVDYVSGSGTNTLTFTYSISPGEDSIDLEYQSTNALVLNGGTISDAIGNPATLTLPTLNTANSLGGSKSLVVDTTAPTITNITSSTANGSYNSGDSISIQIGRAHV